MRQAAESAAAGTASLAASRMLEPDLTFIKPARKAALQEVRLSNGSPPRGRLPPASASRGVMLSKQMQSQHGCRRRNRTE